MPGLPYPPALRIAVTGTDTSVGKTLVTCALATALRASGRRVAAMKPVETGVGRSDVSAGAPAGAPANGPSDAERLRRAAGTMHASADVGPITFAEPLAPLVAGDRAGRSVDVSVLDAARARLDGDADALIVEGAGGLLVPFARDASGGVVDLATLAVRWRLELVVVAANRLGVLNHALLTVREAERRGLVVRVVVLNALRPAPADVAEATNADVLQSLLGRIPVLLFPFVPAGERDDPLTLARIGAPLAAAFTAR